MKAIKFTAITLTLLLLTSCTIYENDIDADVNLVYTSTIDIRSNDFVPVDDFTSVAEYGWDNLDEEMVDYGLVLGYIRFEGTTAWQALPYSIPFENDMVHLRYLFDINNFSLIVEGEVAGNHQENASIFDRDVLRVVAIPPSEIVRGKGFDYTDFREVSNYYNLNWTK